MDKAAKRRLYNAVMVIAILVILTAGVMLVGSLQGWFDGGTAEMAAGTGVTSGRRGRKRRYTGDGRQQDRQRQY